MTQALQESPRSLEIYSPPSTPTREFGPLIQEAISEGKIVYRADIGMPQEPYPDFVKQLLKEAIDEMGVAGYGPEIAPLFAQALINFYQKRFGVEVNPKNLIAGLGASELFPILIDVLTQPGDKIFTFDPHYANFDIPLPRKGVSFVAGKTDEKFHPVISDLEKALKEDEEGKIKAVYLNSPTNPTGAVYTREEIKQIIDLALTHNLWLIWDGVYWNYNFTKNPSSIFEVLTDYSQEDQEEIKKRLVVLDSVSKTFFLCDWRLGWAVIFNPQVKQAVSSSANYRGNISIEIQNAAAKIFSQPNLDQILAENHQLYQRKRDLAYAELQTLASEGLIIADNPPEGGIYITVKLANGINAEEFLYWSLTEYKGPICTFVPLVTRSGSFYTAQEKDSHRDEIRLCLGLPEDQIQEAMKAFANQLRAFISQK